jgi:adenylate cyclase
MQSPTPMAGAPIERRLAAVMAADVVGYSRLMGQDEAGTLIAVRSWRSDVLEPLINRQRGRIFKDLGDGVLVEFGSAVNAVQCAIELQEMMTTANVGLSKDRQIVLRIGINLGDVMVEGSDLYGDGINIAVRLEGIAEPGGVLVSGTVFDYVRNKVDTGFEDLGIPSLKNIVESVRVYRVSGTPRVATATSRAASEKPSIAVLPFANMSGNPDQQYFSDGITEDIITELSRWHQLRVLSRHTSFHYRDRLMEAKGIGSELGVRYVVEGSIRQIGERLRVTAQLLDTETGSHLWAERYDRSLQEIFAVQDEVVQMIVATLVGRMQAADTDVARRKPPTSLAAYDCVLRGYALPYGDPQADAEAHRLYEKAIELDPGYGLAHALLAQMLAHEWDYDMSGSNALLDRALAHAKRGVELDENESVCPSSLGYVYLCLGTIDLAEHYIQRAIAMNPNNPMHIADMAALFVFVGRTDEGIPLLEKAKRIDPYFNPAWYWFTLGFANFMARRHNEAAAAFGRSPTMPFYVCAYRAACYAQMGEPDRARECAEHTLRRKPDFSVRVFASKYALQPVDLEHLVTGLRKAGLPE